MKKFNAGDLVTPLAHTLTIKVLGNSFLRVVGCDGETVTVVYGQDIELSVPVADVDCVSRDTPTDVILSNCVFDDKGEIYFKQKGTTCKEALSALLSKKEFTYDTQKPDEYGDEEDGDKEFTGSLDAYGNLIHVGDVWTDTLGIYDVVNTVDDGYMLKSRSEPLMKGLWHFSQQGHLVEL